jgi:predicted DNA-binding protein YlxM (UPF0122 family)
MAHKRYSSDEVQAWLRLYVEEDKSYREIASTIGAHPYTICKYLNQLPNFSARRKGKHGVFTLDDAREWLRLYNEKNLTFAELAEVTGVSRRTLQKYMYKLPEYVNHNG